MVASVAVVIVAILHVGFFVLESVMWTHPRVRGVFGTTSQEAETTRILALNQGYYNLGVAVLLLFVHFVVAGPATLAVLVYIVAMGLVGGVSAAKAIVLLQSVPAAVAIVLLLT